MHTMSFCKQRELHWVGLHWHFSSRYQERINPNTGRGHVTPTLDVTLSLVGYSKAVVAVW